jgi:hypothetical protein
MVQFDWQGVLIESNSKHQEALVHVNPTIPIQAEALVLENPHERRRSQYQ